MVRAEEEHETMRPCGCHTGRPCTCEMGKKTVLSETFSCGLCVNCRLNTREKTRASKRSLEPRRCLKSAEYFADLDFDRVVLRDDCVFRMRKPDWNAILIQRVYRGLRDRMSLKRIKIRRSLTDRVGALVDKFIVSGDFWGFILEIDADYRRFMHKIAEEEEDAATFLSNVIRQRKHDEDQMMQDWFTASALQNPLVSGIDQVKKTYTNEEDISSGSSVSQAMLQSPLVEDLMALSPNKKKDDIFPPDFPPKIIRQAMAKGFAVSEVIAVM
ncbi:hypothetical protein AM587_10002163 [Phytophthora nicotianae]|uniref:Uncharacterized protein n=1 Tax=Phytophthora nicotianae TaxID=4792 RepID=A0A0W8CXZ6_PHYNI|nr:hypothetical protein AM587_10002163 [Phytophthora nicotianae]